MLLSFIKRTVTKLNKKLFYYPQWFIAIRKTDIISTPPDLTGFKIITPPKGRFYADPFLFEKDGRKYLFYEDYSFLQEKGVIACSELDNEANLKNPRVVLEKSYHLSYPFIFEWDGKIYMMPETSSNRTIEIYRAVEFPAEWILEKTVFKDITAADTTLFEYKNKFWIFTLILLPGKAPDKDLFLYFADSPLGEWKEHPRNPVVSDIKRARPAGNLFISEEQLIRPGQDCSFHYGHSIALNHIEVLDENDFKEITINTITPEGFPGNQSIHTYNFNNEFEVVDGQVIIKDYLKPVRIAAAYVYKFFNSLCKG